MLATALKAITLRSEYKMYKQHFLKLLTGPD